MRYELDENNGINIFEEGNEIPVIYQPHWPDGTPWADAAEARSWAEIKIAEITDPEAPLAGNSPSEPTFPRPTEEDMRLARLRATGLSVDDLKALLGL
jgi:hypothetical protein